eukprot:CCRYP_001605-RA/>CCRYP_001605-RA protein AED:0.15 eAED:0.13 QI:0/0/0/1/1/1/2/0/458
MDKLTYFIYQADRLTPKFLMEAEQHIPLLSEGIMEIIDCTDNVASVEFDDERDDEVEGLNDDDILGGVLDDTEESLEEDDDNEEEHDYSSGDSLASKVMRLWKKRADSMLHNYALAGYLLSPNPIIMVHALAYRTKKHDDAVSVLISKLMLPANLVGPKRATRRAEMRHQFWVQYQSFTLKLGVFADPDIWIIAGNPMTAVYEWWSTYGITRTRVLGNIACIVLSTNLGIGIGSAERHWKLFKASKSGQRARTATEKCKKSALIYRAAMQQRSRHREKELKSAGKLWNDDDFFSLKLDVHCKEIVETASALPLKALRIFRAWEEGWEKVPIGPNGNDLLEARLVRKCGGIKWLDPDNGYHLCVGHPNKMFFSKKRGNNKYLIFVMYECYDLTKNPDEQLDKYDAWEKSQYDFYDEVIKYYEKSNEVTNYKKGMECDSESDEEQREDEEEDEVYLSNTH